MSDDDNLMPLLLTNMTPLLLASPKGGRKIYIGNVVSGSSVLFRRMYGITRIVCLGSGCEYSLTEEELKNGCKKMDIMATEQEDDDLSLHFDKTFDFIESEKKGNVLIHCIAGQNRSGTILINYIMRKNGWGLGKTLSECAKRHGRIKPNRTYGCQLMVFEKRYMLGNYPNARFVIDEVTKEEKFVSGEYKKGIRGIIPEGNIPFTKEDATRYHERYKKNNHFIIFAKGVKDD